MLHQGFVAPRGICLHQDVLVVADTAQNKIFIFQQDAHNNYFLKLTLGNKNNQRNACSGTSLQYPSGVWTNKNILIVADAWNHRVLIWHTFPTTDYQAADVVIGQMGFESNQPNINGLSSSPSAQSLYWPYGVWSDGKGLWIADTGNRRVLYFNHIPTTNFATANEVIGQESFNEKEYDPKNAIWPYSVKISEAGEMIISDTQYNRCLYWKNWKTSLQQSSDFIIGQPDLQSNGQNQYHLKAAANTLNWCYDACFADDGIWIADTGNSRILLYEKLVGNNPSAAALLGQEDFQKNGEASLSMKSTSDHTNNLYWPFAISCYQNKLAVADTGKSRVLIYKLENE